MTRRVFEKLCTKKFALIFWPLIEVDVSGVGNCYRCRLQMLGNLSGSNFG